MKPLVVFILPSFAGGGAERVALTFLNAAESWDRHLIVFDDTGPLAPLVPENITIHRLGTSRLRQAFLSLIKTIRRLKPQAVFSTLGYVNLALLAAKPFLPSGCRLVLREANIPSLSLPQTAYPKLFRFAYRWLYPQADKLLCTSQKMINEMVQHFGVNPDYVVLAPNPVNEGRIRDLAKVPLRIEGLGLRLVCAGRLTHQKGFDQLIEMMKDFPRTTHLTLLGDGPDRGILIAKAKEEGVFNRITFVGFTESPWPHYAGADAFLLPSRWEGMPNAALEALACGTPVISTPEAGAISEVAAQAPDGAVTICSAGSSFSRAIHALSPSNAANQLRPSLLPPIFKIDGAIKTMLATLGGS